MHRQRRAGSAAAAEPAAPPAAAPAPSAAAPATAKPPPAAAQAAPTQPAAKPPPSPAAQAAPTRPAAGPATAAVPERRRRRRRRLAAAAGAASFLACGAAVAAFSGAASTAAAFAAGATGAAGPTDGPASVFKGNKAVGALFAAKDGRLGAHFCTASVVHSFQGNLLITAAHCLLGRSLKPVGSVVFAPGYRNNRFPLGLWDVTAQFVTARWSSRHDPNDDVAFLAVSRPGTPLEQQAGAEYLGVNRALPVAVRVIGYPSTSEQPIICTGPALAFVTAVLQQMKFDCPGYSDGTSGGPFLYGLSARTGDGTVIGVIGGYQSGGDTSDISYSTRFLSNVAALYQTAARPGQPAAQAPAVP